MASDDWRAEVRRRMAAFRKRARADGLRSGDQVADRKAITPDAISKVLPNDGHPFPAPPDWDGSMASLDPAKVADWARQRWDDMAKRPSAWAELRKRSNGTE